MGLSTQLAKMWQFFSTRRHISTAYKSDMNIKVHSTSIKAVNLLSYFHKGKIINSYDLSLSLSVSLSNII